MVWETFTIQGSLYLWFQYFTFSPIHFYILSSNRNAPLILIPYTITNFSSIGIIIKLINDDRFVSNALNILIYEQHTIDLCSYYTGVVQGGGGGGGRGGGHEHPAFKSGGHKWVCAPPPTFGQTKCSKFTIF